MELRLTNMPIHPHLQGLVEKLWVFESSGRVPNPDMKLIVPNGLIKLVIPFNNGLAGQRDGYCRISKKHQLTLIGISDVPFIVDAEEDAPAGTIGMEFNPAGAYRFFRLRLTEIKNQIYLLDDVIGKLGKEIELRISGTDSVNDKVNMLQYFLIEQLQKNRVDDIFDACIQKIKSTNGKVTIGDLEKYTGYSARWLNMKFDERIGVSPKNLCAITRFQFVYHTLVNNPKAMINNKGYYQIYYDQSHFIKEFKRFTGMPPQQFMHSSNDFGKIFYKD